MIDQLPIEIFWLCMGLFGVVLGVGLVWKQGVFTMIAGIMLVLIMLPITSLEYDRTVERSIQVSSVLSTVVNNATVAYMNATTFGTTDHMLGITRTLSGSELGASSSLIGDDFNMMQVDLQRNGSPTGTLYAGVWSGTAAPTDANYLCLIGTYSVPSVPTSRATIEIMRSDGLFCSASSGEVIGVYYDDGSVGNTLAIFRSTTGEASLFDGANTFLTSYNSGVFSDSTNLDYSMAVVGFYDTTADAINRNSFDTVGGESLTVEFDYTVKALVMIFAGLLMMFGWWQGDFENPFGDSV